MIKVQGIICKLTGTDDYYEGSDCPEAKTCSYSKMCQAKFDKEQLEEAKQNWIEGNKLLNEGQMLIDMAREVFQKHCTDNEILKYQLDHLMINRIYIAPSTTYPKAKLLKVFSPEQLEPCAEHKEATWQLRVNDLLKEKKTKDK